MVSGLICYVCIMRFLVNDFTAEFSLSDFDLSRIESLQQIEVNATSIDRAPLGLPDRSTLLKYALSTIRSPEFNRVVFIYQEHDFHGVDTGRRSEWPHLHKMSSSERSDEKSRHSEHLQLLNDIHQLRGFQPVLCANVWEPVGEYTVQVLKDAVAMEKTDNLVPDSFPGPLVTYNPHWDLRCGVYP